MTTKPITLENLKAGDKVICIKKSSHPKFIKGDEYDIVMRTDSLYIVSHTYDLFAINKRTLETINEHFSLLTPQQPERLLTEADLVVGNRFECIEDMAFFKPGLVYEKGKEYLCEVDGFITNRFGERNFGINSDELNRHFKLISQTAQKEVNGQDEQSFYEFIYDTIDEVLYGAKSTSVGIALIDQAVKKEVFQKTSLLQQEVEKLRELLKESKRFCGGSLQAKIDNQLNK